ncbi:BatD family protein [Tenacibaculum aquimarinum]|uniref:BatD family protein n=1 Tax=Tenacibaculum aquimarinum TaxID=2910675 RepID=UPI001F0AC34D|nr:BatD family protein [Tenacibaculum aquimarinum]MCH3881612.1 BatD family protein [Tenacibaculum aquimarinum]MCH3883524.1 BatD family protein [Tenacibaculum aquimarinum]
MKLKFYITFILSFLAVIATAQETELTATVSKNKLGVNQRLRVQFTINKQGADNFKSPNFTNFKVVGGPSQSVSQSWINGKASFSQSYTYIIEPKRQGEFNIPSASIEIEGKTLQSKPVKIIVTGAVKVPKNPNDPNYIAEQNIHLVAEISKSRPYVGEGIYVEYRLYFSENVGIYDNAITQAPQYNGFWNQEIKLNGIQAKIGEYNGERYRYAVLHKAYLIPTKSGKLTVDPMKMDIVVAVPTGRGDFFGNPITRQVRRDFASARKTIQVKDLPLENKPEDFTGAVGEFSFDVTLSKNTLKANESSQIKVGVKGKGNLKLFELPTIETPEELEVYAPERKEKVSVGAGGLRGEVYDLYTVVPEYKGKYKIPNTSFSYFNPKEKAYQTITTEDLYVDVLEGKELVAKVDENTVNKQAVKATGNNFRYIQTSSSFATLEKDDFFKSNLFYVLLLLPLLSIPIGIFLAKKKEERDGDIIGNRLRKADKLAKKYLSEAQKQLGKKEAFYEALERALHNYLKAKLGIETSDISREKITLLLQDKKIDSATISQFIDVLKSSDFARYTPITNLQMEEEYNNAKQVITQLDKQL